MKKVLPILFFVVLIAAIVQGLYIWQPQWFSFLERTPVTPLEGEEEPAADGEVREDGQYYEIAADYPGETALKESAGATADAKARAIIETFIETEIERFKDNGQFASLSAEEAAAQGYGDGRKQELKITYQEFSSDTTISVVFTIYQDTLGAHGNTFYRTFTFDSKTGEGLLLHDFFREGSDYLDRLSRITREKLEMQLGEFADEEMIESGTTAFEDNFQSWYAEGDALVIIFPPYQVAAYAAGPQKVSIPLEELASVLQ